MALLSAPLLQRGFLWSAWLLLQPDGLASANPLRRGLQEIGFLSSCAATHYAASSTAFLLLDQNPLLTQMMLFPCPGGLLRSWLWHFTTEGAFTSLDIGSDLASAIWLGGDKRGSYTMLDSPVRQMLRRRCGISDLMLLRYVVDLACCQRLWSKRAWQPAPQLTSLGVSTSTFKTSSSPTGSFRWFLEGGSRG